MTDLNKVIRRVTRSRRHSQSKWRPLIVSLEPGDVIGVRLQGTRQTYRRAIETVYEDAIQHHVRRTEKRARQIAKDQGLKMRAAMAKARKELAEDLKP